MKWSSLKRDKSINDEELYARAKNGDNDSRELLFKNNIPYMLYLVHKWRNNIGFHIDKDEKIGICSLEMQVAYDHYDPDKKVKFATFMNRCIQNKIRKMIRDLKRIKNSKYNTISIDGTYTYDDSPEGDALHSVLSDGNSDDAYDKIANSVLLNDILKKFYDSASEIEKVVFEKIYYEGKKYRDIGKEIGTSKSSVDRVQKRIIEKLRSIGLVQNVS